MIKWCFPVVSCNFLLSPVRYARFAGNDRAEPLGGPQLSRPRLWQRLRLSHLGWTACGHATHQAFVLGLQGPWMVFFEWETTLLWVLPWGLGVLGSKNIRLGRRKLLKDEIYLYIYIYIYIIWKYEWTRKSVRKQCQNSWSGDFLMAMVTGGFGQVFKNRGCRTNPNNINWIIFCERKTHRLENTPGIFCICTVYDWHLLTVYDWYISPPSNHPGLPRSNVSPWRMIAAARWKHRGSLAQLMSSQRQRINQFDGLIMVTAMVTATSFWHIMTSSILVGVH